MPIEGDKIFFEFDPIGDKKLSASDRRDALDAIADFVKEQVLEYVGDGKSPVSGGKWKRSLSAKYAAIKSEQSSAGFANMELTGEMLDALEVVVNDDVLSLQITGDQAAKADGHNNHSGDSSLPERRFIPDEGQNFKQDILRGIAQIVESFDEVVERQATERETRQTTRKSTNQTAKEATKKVRFINPNGETIDFDLEDIFE
jgi:hypothetical protein